MVIQRKGKAVKFEKMWEELNKATTAEEAFRALEKFNLSNIEENQLVKTWKSRQQIFKTHGIRA